MGQGHIPDTWLFRAYHKLHLYIPTDLWYILACKLMTSRPDKDFSDIALLRQKLNIQTCEQARSLVRQFFPDPYHQHLYKRRLSEALAAMPDEERANYITQYNRRVPPWLRIA